MKRTVLCLGFFLPGLLISQVPNNELYIIFQGENKMEKSSGRIGVPVPVYRACLLFPSGIFPARSVSGTSHQGHTLPK